MGIGLLSPALVATSNFRITVDLLISVQWEIQNAYLLVEINGLFQREVLLQDFGQFTKISSLTKLPRASQADSGKLLVHWREISNHLLQYHKNIFRSSRFKLL